VFRIHIAVLLGWNTTVRPREYLYRRVEVLLKCALRQRRRIECEYEPTYRRLPEKPRSLWFL